MAGAVAQRVGSTSDGPSWLFGVFAGIALLMAVGGIYGVVSYAVARRTPAIGIRMALGAGPGKIVSQVLREGMLLAGIGLTLGLAGAWYTTRLVGNLLAGVNPHDPRVYAAVILGLASAGLAPIYCRLCGRRPSTR